MSLCIYNHKSFAIYAAFFIIPSGNFSCFSKYLRQVPAVSAEFDLIEIIGRGTYGTVFLATLKNVDDSEKYALKYLSLTSRSGTNNEIKALQTINKHSNVIELLTCIRHLDQVVMIFPYIDHDCFTDLIGELSLS